MKFGVLDINFYYQIINNFYHLQCSPFKFILIQTQGQHLADFYELYSWKSSVIVHYERIKQCSI